MKTILIIIIPIAIISYLIIGRVIANELDLMGRLEYYIDEEETTKSGVMLFWPFVIVWKVIVWIGDKINGF